VQPPPVTPSPERAAGAANGATAATEPDQATRQSAVDPVLVVLVCVVLIGIGIRLRKRRIDGDRGQ
jgi:hypothetical protein